MRSVVARCAVLGVAGARATARRFGAWGCGDAREIFAPAFSSGDVPASRGTPLRVCAGSGSCETSVRKTILQLFKRPTNSSAAARGVLRSGTIRKQIIGRGMAVPRLRFSTGGNGFRAAFLGRVEGLGAMLHEPASEHGGGILFEPGIEQLANLLAEIGGVAQARQLITLQRIARCGEKELPRRLGLVVQGGLPKKSPSQNKRSVNAVKVQRFSTYCGYVWKVFGWDCEQATLPNLVAPKFGGLKGREV